MKPITIYNEYKPRKTERIVFKVVAIITQCTHRFKHQHHVVPIHIYSFYELVKRAKIVKTKNLKSFYSSVLSFRNSMPSGNFHEHLLPF